MDLLNSVSSAPVSLFRNLVIARVSAVPVACDGGVFPPTKVDCCDKAPGGPGEMRLADCEGVGLAIETSDQTIFVNSHVSIEPGGTVPPCQVALITN